MEPNIEINKFEPSAGENSSNIHPVFNRLLSRDERQNFLKQKSLVVWMTGLSGSGKSTIAIELERKLFEHNYFVQVLDGDNVRTGINNNLGFTLEDRAENIRRIAEIAKLYLNSGVITICTFVSPTNEIRSFAKSIIGNSDFFEIFINTPVEICEQRDVKGLYKKARAGEIKEFTGINSPFEAPSSPDLVISAGSKPVEACVLEIFLKIQPLIKNEL